MVKERNIAMAIILTIITCGIYGIFWFIGMTDDASRLSEDTSVTGGKAFLFTLLTCGIYGIYWYYKMGQMMHIAHQKNSEGVTEDKSTLLLVLGVFGLGFVAMIILQSDINTFATTQQQ